MQLALWDAFTHPRKITCMLRFQSEPRTRGVVGLRSGMMDVDSAACKGLCYQDRTRPYLHGVNALARRVAHGHGQSVDDEEKQFSRVMVISKQRNGGL